MVHRCPGWGHQVTRARRRVVRLALRLRIAGIEPVFAGSTYREIEAGLAKEWAALTPSRRKAVRRQALRLISDAQGLKKAGDHWVPRPLQQGSTGREPPILPSLEQMPRQPPEMPRCSSCRMRFGLRRKRRFPSEAAAQQFCASLKDPGLVVYACPAGAGFHLGHPQNTKSATSSLPSTAQRREPNLVNAHVAPTPNPLHKESPINMRITLGHPILITIYSAALLLIGCGVGSTKK